MKQYLFALNYINRVVFSPGRNIVLPTAALLMMNFIALASPHSYIHPKLTAHAAKISVLNRSHAPGMVKKNNFNTAKAGNTASAALLPVPPAISYSTPQTYYIGTAITPLAPTGSGVDALGYSAWLLASGIAPKGVAADAAGNLYVACLGGIIKKVPAKGGSPVTFSSGFTQPAGIAIDAPGNVYISDPGVGKIYKIAAKVGTKTIIGTGFSQPMGVAVDAGGNVYVADELAKSVTKIPAGGGVPIVLSTDFQQPRGVATDAGGNVYIADVTAGTVRMIPAGGGPLVTLVTGLGGPTGIAIDCAGNLYVVSPGSGMVTVIPPGGGTGTTYVTGYPQLDYVAVDALGDVFVSSQGSNALVKLKPLGGYFLAIALPAGLQFSEATGIISGTPTALSANASYKITAYNATGSSQAVVRIAVNPIPSPVVKYPAAQTVLAGVAMQAISPTTSSWVSPPGYNSAVAVGSGFINPAGLAVDVAGNVYVGNIGNGTVQKVPAGGGAPVIIGSGFSVPRALAVDAAGNVYVADQGNNDIKKIPAGGGVPVIIASGLTTPTAITLDAAGNLYAADLSNSITKITPGGDKVTITTPFPFTGAQGIAVDVAGNIYIATSGAILKIPASGGLVTGAPGPQIFSALGLAIDAAGNLYVADLSTNSILKFALNNPGSVTVVATSTRPVNIAVDAAGNVYAADPSINAVTKFSPSGGFHLGSPLPDGLNFDEATGTISGTPVAARPATSYTVTAYGKGGSSKAAVKLTVKTVPPPVVKYDSPQVYREGIPVSPVFQPENNAAPLAYSPATLNIGLGIVAPAGLAVDAAGNVYVADQGNKALKKIPAGGGIPITLSTGFDKPVGVALDAAGNIYVTDANSNTVFKIPAGGGTKVVIGGINNPGGVAVDAAGNVFVVDRGNNALRMIQNGGGPVLTVASGLNSPRDVAVDAAGDIYVTNLSGGITRFPANGKEPPKDYFVGTALVINFDATGNLFYAGGSIAGILPRVWNGPQVTFTQFTLVALNFNTVGGIAVDAAGNVYVSDTYNNQVRQIKPSGGYFITPALPAGLQLISATGVITGLPTATSPAKNYTVSAYNSGGKSTAKINIAVKPLPAPDLKYPTPQIYLAGATIPPLLPITNVAPAAFSYKNPVAAGTGFNMPTAVAYDAAGNIYVADNGNNAIKKIPAGGGAPVTILTPIVGVTSIATDAAGNVYAATGGQGGSPGVTKIPAGGGTPTSFASPLINPLGIAVDAAGNIFLNGNTGNTIVMAPATGGQPFFILRDFNTSASIAADAAGNLYLTDVDARVVRKIPKGGGPSVIIGGGFINPAGVAVDAAGNVYVADIGNKTITMLPTTGGFERILSTGIYAPQWLAVDGAGNVCFTSNNEVKKISPSSGFYLANALPAGLHFNSNSGIISGIPQAAVSAKNYTVTVYYNDGASHTAVNIKIALAPPPVISYASPQTYITGTPISPLAPTGNGVALPGYGTPAIIAGNIDARQSLAPDAAGNVYIVAGPDVIMKIPPGGGFPLFITTVAAGNLALAIDKAGNLYVSGSTNNQNLIKIPAGGGTQVTVNTGLGQVQGIAIDEADNIYVASPGDGTIKKIPAGGGAAVTIASGLFQVSKLAADGQGNIYVISGNTIKKIQAGGNVTDLPVSFAAPSGIAADAAGNLYVAEFGTSSIKMIPAGGGSPITVAQGLLNISAIAIDAAGNLYTSCDIATDNIPVHTVKKISITGGYFLKTGLPAGLNFDAMTGIISGTPTTVTPIQNYKVSAIGQSTAEAIVRIKVVAPKPGNQSLSLAGTRVPAGVQLAWDAETDGSAATLTVERSIDNGKTFNTLGDATSTHSLVDKSPVNGLNQYRLKQQDLSGVSYSAVAVVPYSNSKTVAANSISIYPNPATNSINVYIKPAVNVSWYDIKIVNNIGTVVKAATLSQASWQTWVGSLMPGTYVVQVLNGKDKSIIGSGTFIKL